MLKTVELFLESTGDLVAYNTLKNAKELLAKDVSLFMLALKMALAWLGEEAPKRRSVWFSGLPNNGKTKIYEALHKCTD